MVQFTGRQDFALDEAKVLVDVRVTRLRIDGGMSFGVHRVLVDPRVQGGDIDVVNFLAGGDMMVELMALVRPPQKASRGLSGWIKLSSRTKASISGWVFRRWSHPHPHI